MSLRIIPDSEREEYFLFCDRVAYCILHNAANAVYELQKTMDHDKVVGVSEEIGLAVGQIVHDKVIELTKDMSKDQLVKYLAEAVFNDMTNIMNKHPDYKLKLLMQGNNL